ncbi:MAG TPA: hypothetical protein VKG01_02535 [Thermoanaerobaculia bacterium]|nr:hypothetical protein [Thermoanaerobaculia bacterium]
MRRIGLVAILFLGLVSLPALADDCALLGGNIVAGECVIDGTAPGVAPNNRTGTFNIAETLRIKGTGKITVPSSTVANSLILNITGQFVMEDGAVINGNTFPTSGGTSASQQGATITITASGDITLAGDSGNGGAKITAEMNAGSCSGGGRGGNITLVSGGDLKTFEGSLISSNSGPCSAGDIVLKATPAGAIDVDGSVLARSLRSGDGSGKAGGGRITLIAGCKLIVSDTGVVSSQGKDQGADLVHLEACQVTIEGLVESALVQGGGHADNTDNACNNPPLHPGAGGGIVFTGCVEIWSGTTIEITKTQAGLNGEVSADGVVANRTWIDIFANGNITITNDTAGYAVHANPSNATNNHGGVITIKSAGGNISTTGNAIQANAVGSGGEGGIFDIEAFGDVSFGASSIQAEGTNTGGGPQKGGQITVQAFNGLVSGNAPGELNANGGGGGGTVGFVTLTGCGTANPGDGVNYTGTVTPASPNPVQPDSCGGAPVIPVALPANCSQTCREGPEPAHCEKASVQSVLDPQTGRFPGNLGPDKVIFVQNGDIIQNFVDSAADLNNDGYIILMVVAKDNNQLGGSTKQKVDISLNYPKPFALFGCSVTLIDPDKNDSLPAGLIEASAGSPQNIFVMDLHGSGSEIAGWKVVGNGRYVRNVANSGNFTGIWFLGNNNTMHNGNGNNNTNIGIFVVGSGNTLDSADAFGNGGDGVGVLGDNNKVLKLDIGDRGKGNGGNGLVVGGNGNLLQENDVYANVGLGIGVHGNGNKLLKNNAGDRTKGNGSDGIQVNGATNTIQENDSLSNSGNGFNVFGGTNTYSKNQAGDRGDQANGLAGFLLSGGGTTTENTAIGNLGDGMHLVTAGFTLKNNISGGTGSGQPNALCQFRFDVAGNTNSGGNKSNGVTVSGNPLAAGCK